MFKKKNILSLWLPMILTVLLTVLQLLPIPTCEQQLLYTSFICCIKRSTWKLCSETIAFCELWEIFKVWLWEYRLYIAVILSVIILIGLVVSMSSNQVQREWLKKYLQITMNELFPDPSGTERCTLFVKEKGFRVMMRYLYKILYTCAKQHKQEETFDLHLKRTPSPFKDYYTMQVRVNGSYSDGTSTYFNVCKSGQENYGWVSLCAYHKISKLIETKQISTFYDTRKTSFYGNTAKLNEYISACKISREQLKCIHQRSNHLYVVPISDKDERDTIAVLVLDIDSSQEHCIDNELQDRFGYVARVVATVIRD